MQGCDSHSISSFSVRVWLGLLDIHLATPDLYHTPLLLVLAVLVTQYIRAPAPLCTRLSVSVSMFTADLSWTDPHTEKVGERKERIAKKKEKERSISSAAPSINSVRSVKSSIFEGRELWWPSSFKKARSIKPTSKSRDTSYGSTRTRLGSTSLPKTLEVNTANIVRDPTLQPSWTYSTTLSPTLPSGASLEAHEYEVPELEGDISSRGTESSGSRSSRKFRVRCPTKKPSL